MAKSAKLQVLYEDNHLIAVWKPEGVLTQGDASGAESLLEMVRSYLKQKHSKPGNVFVGLVHRLDRPVAGVVVFAKTSKGASRISEQIRQHSVRKLYQALVEGEGLASEGVLIHYLKEEGFGTQVGETEKPGWKKAELVYRVLERGKRTTLVEIDLKTGRKHQIRAQFSCIGYPIVGDFRYGAKQSFKPEGIALMAVSFEFSHPTRSDERICVALDPKESWKPWL
jgi:23S rRNA pseudouridine1911/1915/1917 synthase